MKKKILRLGYVCTCLLLLISCGPTQQKVVSEDVSDVTIRLADPTIFYHDGTYYLYGTTPNPAEGFLVYNSDDLQTWRGPDGVNDGYALRKGDSFGTAGFWAPQVFEYKGKIYMAYTANEQIAIAESDHPNGPFKQQIHKSLSGDLKQIDPYIFVDDDGKVYLYHVWLNNGNNLYVSEMKEDLSEIKPGTTEFCFKGELPWENTENSNWPITEGPTIIKHNGLYYFFYSANNYVNPDYAVGYAVSESPKGPWRKMPDSPIINKELLKKNGTGHGDFFKDADNNWNYVFHTHYSDSVIHPRLTAIVPASFVADKTAEDKMKIDYAGFRYLNVKKTPYQSANNHDRNPVLKGYYADPEILYAEQTGKFYIYPTTDGFLGWCNYYFKTFSSDNMVDWVDEGVILDLQQQVPWGPRNAWAPCIIEKKINGEYKYFYYFTAAQKIGVAVANHPIGPFIDSGKPLINSRPQGVTGGQQIDPDVFSDPQTGKNYLYWGNGYMAGAELNEDMVSINESTIKVMTPDETFREGACVFYRNGTYYFLWSEDDTGSENYKVRYGISYSPLGELEIPANNIVIQKDPSKGILGTGHNSIIQVPTTDDWYIVYHRFGIPVQEAPGSSRVVCIDKMTFNPDGTIVEVKPTLESISKVTINSH